MLASLSIVVPVYNEETTLAEVVAGCVAVAPRVAARHEIWIVDDGSQDASPRVAEECAARWPEVRVLAHDRNRGFGASQQTGIAASTGEFLVVVPSDGQFDPADLVPLAAAAPQADIVVGYRQERDDSLYRRTKTWVFGQVMQRYFGVGLRDVNWVKLYRRSVFEKLPLRAEGIGVEAEVIVKARALGLRLVEVPVGYHPRRAGVAKGDQPLRVLGTLAELWKLGRGRL